MSVMSVLRAALAVACAQFALASPPTGLRGALTNETHAGRPEEAEQLEDLSGGADGPNDKNQNTVANQSSAAANLTAVLPLYHQTSPEIAALILQSGFKPGTSGWCGGGIYFATTPQATYTKAIGPHSHKGFVIEAQVNVSRVLHMPKTCNRSMTGPELWSQHYDSIKFNPGDGDEYVVYSMDRVVSMKKYSK